jgi:hypothetical protein
MRKSLLLLGLMTMACRKVDNTVPDSIAAVDSPIVAVDSLPAEKTCGVKGTPFLEEDGIGELKQGRPVSEVSALCDVISDAEQRGQEGMMERVLVVNVAGESVRSVVQNDRIFRIEVNTPRFRTADSLGVDTPLSRIASMRGAQFAPGEDGVYGFSPDHCGLSFRFSLPWRPPAGGQWTAKQIEEEHSTAAVNRVIIIPCRR